MDYSALFLFCLGASVTALMVLINNAVLGRRAKDARSRADQLTEALANVKALEEKITAGNAKVASQRSELEARSSDLKKAEAAAAATLVVRTAELKRVQKEAAQAEIQIKGLLDRCQQQQTLARTVAEKEDALSGAETDLATRRARYDAERVAFERQKMEIQTLRADVVALKASLDSEFQHKRALEQELAGIRAAIQSIESGRVDLVRRHAVLENLEKEIEQLTVLAASKFVRLDDALRPIPATDPDGSMMCPICWQRLQGDEEIFTPRHEQGRLAGLFRTVLPVPSNPDKNLALPGQTDQYMFRLADAVGYIQRKEVNEWCDRHLRKWGDLDSREQLAMLFEPRCPNRPCWSGYVDGQAGEQIMGLRTPIPMFQTVRIAMVGASHTGKTAYITVLMHELLTRGLDHYGLHARPGTTASFHESERLIGRLYSDRIIEATAADARHDIDFDIMRPGCADPIKKLFLRDMAGEKFQGIQPGSIDMDHLLFADFLFFFLDPMASASLRQAITGNRTGYEENVLRDQTRILVYIAQILREYRQDPPQLIVLLTKADEFRDHFPEFLQFDTPGTSAIAENMQFTLFENWDHRRPANEFRRFSQTVSTMIRERLQQHPDMARLLTTIETFQAPMFFPVSALGNRTRMRDGKDRLEAAPQPMHVIDPIAYVLDRACDLDVIKTDGAGASTSREDKG